jgi:hypothetical protein
MPLYCEIKDLTSWDGALQSIQEDAVDPQRAEACSLGREPTLLHTSCIGILACVRHLLSRETAPVEMG